jgi:hypothetical protein
LKCVNVYRYIAEGKMVWCNNLTDIYLKLYELDFGGAVIVQAYTHGAHAWIQPWILQVEFGCPIAWKAPGFNP